MKDNPLVSFIVIAYNQENYIKEAIIGAFSQTYEPLEIILSDDNSPDGTFEIMQKIASEYQGPHKIVLNQNNPNQGIGGHINRVMEIAKGDFIVVNAGDDISIPERTTELVDVWLKSDRKAKSVCSDCYKMDLNGNVYDTLTFDLFDSLISPEKFLEKNARVIGATHGWDRDIFEYFGPIDSKVIHEDCVLPFRSILIGKVEYINRPLIKYRDGGISSSYSSKDNIEILHNNMLKINERYYVDYSQKISDLKVMTNLKEQKKLISLARMKQSQFKYVIDMSSDNSISKKIFFLFNHLLSGAPVIRAVKVFFKFQLSKLYKLYLSFRYKN